MTREQLDEIINDSPETIRELLGELHQDIIEAARSALSEEGNGKLKVSAGITIDLTKAPPTWTAEAAVSVRHKAVAAAVTVSDATPHLPGMGRN